MQFNTESFLKLINFPSLTEKNQLKLNTYTFITSSFLTKTQIKTVFKNFFNLDILSINTSNVHKILKVKKHKYVKFNNKLISYKKISIVFKPNQNTSQLFSNLVTVSN